MSLKTWVSDQLYGLVGYSDTNLAEYVCNLAASERSAHSLLTKLQDADVPMGAAASKFAQELFARTPRQSKDSASSSSRSKADKEAAALLARNAQYAMLDDDEEDEVSAAVQAALKAKKKAEREREKEVARQAKREAREDKKRIRSDADSSLTPAEEEQLKREQVRNVTHTHTILPICHTAIFPTCVCVCVYTHANVCVCVCVCVCV